MVAFRLEHGTLVAARSRADTAGGGHGQREQCESVHERILDGVGADSRTPRR
jgi:hypothetical protein